MSPTTGRAQTKILKLTSLIFLSHFIVTMTMGTRDVYRESTPPVSKSKWNLRT